MRAPGEVGTRRSWDDTYVRAETPERMMRWATTHHPMVLPLMRARRVLEVGTGTGMLSGFLALAGVEVVSLDLSAEVQKVAAQFHRSIDVEVEMVVGDGMETGLASDSFDAVFSQGLWEHFSDRGMRCLAVEGLRLAPAVYASMPSAVYPRLGHRGPGLVGNERFLTASRYRTIMAGIGRVTTVSYADWKVATFAGVTLPYKNQLLVTVRRDE